MPRFKTKTPAEYQAYQARVKVQMLAWAQGNPWHNRVDDECTPDFSCCIPDMFEKNENRRWEKYRCYCGTN